MTTKVGSSVLGASLTLVTPVLGTPTSGTLTNCTLPYSGLSGTVPTWNQNTSGTAAGLSATLAVGSGGTGVTTSTGSGSVVLSTSPTLVTPNLGTPTTLVGTNITGTAASLTVGNATTASNLNGTWAQMPAGTVTNFYQAAAPTGWVQRTDLNDFMLYIVSGAGGYAAGIHSPTVMNVVPYHTHGFSTGYVSADHVHYDSGHTHQYSAPLNGQTTGGSIGVAQGPYTQTTQVGTASIGGASGNHTHSGGTDGGSSQTNWSPKYLANIMCYKS